MAQEVQGIEPSAVSHDREVNYDRLGLNFMTWNEWLGRTGAKSQAAY